jgi:uncharacterized Zn finger protein (UPF0148 family)
MDNDDACPNCGWTEFEDDEGRIVCSNCGRVQDRNLITEEEGVEGGIKGNVVRKKRTKEKVKASRGKQNFTQWTALAMHDSC